jgi:predicted RNA-binding Zn ribbon-like protein
VGLEREVTRVEEADLRGGNVAPERLGAGREEKGLARDTAYAALEAVPGAAGEESAGRAVRWRWERRWRRPEQLLQPVAHAMGDLVCHADFSYVRRCERCTLWFLDVSRGHQRRWCSMALCGNRAKAEAYRQR